MLILDDCINLLKHIEEDSVDLIYLDPPFFTQKTQKLKTRNNIKEYSFDDSWMSLSKYKLFIKQRLVICKRVLKETGSLFLHCDKAASHYLRLALDEVFGYKNFQSEIVWSYKRWSNSKKGLLNSHQIIFFYSKTKDFKFHQMYQDYSLTTNLDQIFQERSRNVYGKTIYKKDGSKYVLLKNKKGVPLSDVWEMPYLNPKANERVGYPTQKPILLLEQIIKLASEKGDIVLDPFCGSGTTLVAAQLLNRKYIGVDISKDAIHLTEARLKNPIRSESLLMKKGKDAYKNQREDILQILKSLNAYPVQRNKGIDGFLKIGEDIKPIPIKVQRSSENLKDAKELLLRACQKNNFKKKILISTEVKNQQSESNLFIFHKSQVHQDMLNLHFRMREKFHKKL